LPLLAFPPCKLYYKSIIGWGNIKYTHTHTNPQNFPFSTKKEKENKAIYILKKIKKIKIYFDKFLIIK
jgi:hypothetical protein